MKYGNATLGQVEAVWNNLGGEKGVARFLAGELVVTEKNSNVSVVPSTTKFSLFADLGILTVPADYNHSIQLSKFMAAHRGKFYAVNNNITDQNFPNPTRILKPGDKLWVRAFKQIVLGTTTSLERIAFLDSLKAHHTGAQGLSLIFEQKRD